MRKALVGLATAAFVAILVPPASAKMQTITGLLVDLACYQADQSNIKQRHAMKNGPVENCATSCAKKGQPVAIVTSDGGVYVVIGQYTANKNQSLLSHMAHTVQMTGDVSINKDGATISAISLKDVQ
jgi:hypothetical protein